MPVPHYFDYCGFVVTFEIRKFKFSNFVLLVHDCFNNQGLHINLKIAFLISPATKKSSLPNCTLALGTWLELSNNTRISCTKIINVTIIRMFL